MKITEIKKEGPIFILQLDEDNKALTYNVQTNTLTSYTNRKLKRFPAGVANKGDVDWYYSSKYPDKNMRYIINNIKDAITYNNLATINSISLFWLYQDLWHTAHTSINLPTECPKGYIKWVKENNETITPYSLTNYKNYLFEKNKPKAFTMIEEKLAPAGNSYYIQDFLNRIKSFSIQKLEKINQILTVTLKTFTFSFEADLKLFMKHIRDLEDWEDCIDTNRSFNYNNDLIENVLNKQINEKIAAFENIGRAITKIQHEKYIIKIPNNINDMVEEGKQQNNCVGRMYPQRVADRDSYIYFIRHKDCPNKSYVTCEFNMRARCTTQALTINNGYHNNPSIGALTKQIDDILKVVFQK